MNKKLIIGYAVMLSFLLVLTIINVTTPKEKEIEYITVTAPTENYVYRICDVYGLDIELGMVTAVMPNGDLEIFYIDDIPEGADIVVFRASDLDDYNTYEICKRNYSLGEKK